MKHYMRKKIGDNVFVDLVAYDGQAKLDLVIKQDKEYRYRVDPNVILALFAAEGLGEMLEEKHEIYEKINANLGE